MSMQKTFFNIPSAIEQIDACGFECEAGPLSLNIAYEWLKGAAKVGPEFIPGQGVYYEVRGKVSGVEMSKWAHFYIVGCQMDSDTENRFWTYDLSRDPPAPWHYGTVEFRKVRARDLSLNPPVAAGG